MSLHFPLPTSPSPPLPRWARECGARRGFLCRSGWTRNFLPPKTFHQKIYSTFVRKQSTFKLTLISRALEKTEKGLTGERERGWRVEAFFDLNPDKGGRGGGGGSSRRSDRERGGGRKQQLDYRAPPPLLVPSPSPSEPFSSSSPPYPTCLKG